MPPAQTQRAVRRGNCAKDKTRVPSGNPTANAEQQALSRERADNAPSTRSTSKRRSQSRSSGRELGARALNSTLTGSSSRSRMPEYSTTGCSAASASWPRAQWYANSAPLDSTAAVSSAAAYKWPVLIPMTVIVMTGQSVR